MRFISRILLGLAGLALVGAAARLSSRIAFDGRAIIITGGSRGLGLVLARLLATEGARLMLVARDEGELNRAAAELRAYGAEVATFVGDVADPSVPNAVVEATLGAFGRIDMLINNAGMIIVGPLENMTEADYESALALHFWAPLRLMNAALPHLKATRGRVVNISSIGGKIAVPHLAPYSASKFALAGLSDAYRSELARDGVTVTSVFPGLMRTGSHIQALFKGQQEKEYAWFAMGSATPLSSASAERAARKIIRACRYGRPEIVVSLQAKLAVWGNAIFPNLGARLAALLNRGLPRPGDTGKARPGYEVRNGFPPRWLTTLPDQASEKNNELPS